MTGMLGLRLDVWSPLPQVVVGLVEALAAARMTTERRHGCLRLAGGGGGVGGRWFVPIETITDHGTMDGSPCTWFF
jgi:hypothetical protein